MLSVTLSFLACVLGRPVLYALVWAGISIEIAYFYLFTLSFCSIIMAIFSEKKNKHVMEVHYLTPDEKKNARCLRSMQTIYLVYNRKSM